MTNKTLLALSLILAFQVSHVGCRVPQAADPEPAVAKKEAPKPAAARKTPAELEKLRAANKAAVDARYKENLKKHEGNADMLVLPGIVADRKAKQVIFQAEATGLTGKGEPPEFFIIAENSGHDYESLAIAFAKPSDVHQALLFIGMESGRRVNFEKLQFWPKGERVKLFLSYKDGDKAVGPLRMEKLFIDTATGKVLAETGLVFTGSEFMNSTTEPGQKVYAADACDPNAIAANYNEPSSVLDVPRQAPQKLVYNHLTVNADSALPDGVLIDITLEPEYKDGKKRVKDLSLGVDMLPGKTGADMESLALTLTDSAGKALNAAPDLNSVLAQFTALAKEGRDSFVTLRLGDAVPVKSINALASVLGAIDVESGIRMEPPVTNQLYYKAFTPDQGFRAREGRIFQPWELRLSVKDGKTTGMLTEIHQIWKEEQIKPDLVVKDLPVASGDELRQKLVDAMRREKELSAAYEKTEDEAARKKIEADMPTRLRVIIVYAQPTITHKDLMGFIQPAMATHPLVHVFVE